MESTGKTFAKTTEILDGNSYSECRFESCRLIFRGGTLPVIARCHFENCQWSFEDAAERTLVFMRQLYHGMGPGGVELIEATLGAIRQPPRPANPGAGE